MSKMIGNMYWEPHMTAVPVRGIYAVHIATKSTWLPHAENSFA